VTTFTPVSFPAPDHECPKNFEIVCQTIDMFPFSTPSTGSSGLVNGEVVIADGNMPEFADENLPVFIQE